jgi:hypothetical protein
MQKPLLVTNLHAGHHPHSNHTQQEKQEVIGTTIIEKQQDTKV